MITDSDLTQHLEYPVESYNLELKRWINPNDDKGSAKLVRACIALRNSNGGMLIIGLNDDKSPDEANRPSDIHALFNQDAIQGLISKYSSQAFEVEVRFVTRGKSDYPVIIIPSGVKTPIAIKKELKIDGNNTLLRLNAIYVRTLQANNIVSTAEASGTDWERLTGICFENRESDIGQFIRRHLTPENISLLGEQMKGANQIGFKPPNNIELGHRKFVEAMKRASISIPKVGYFEVSFLMQGEVSQAFNPDEKFLNLISSANRNLTGWPFFLDSRGFSEKQSYPYVKDHGWQALFESEFHGKRFDFWRISPDGFFYAIRTLDDDTGGSHKPSPNSALDPALIVWRVAEVLILAVAFAKAMTFKDGNSNIYVCLRWTELENRVLENWSGTAFDFFIQPLGRSEARQNAVESNLVLPTGTPDASIFQYVSEGVRPLFNLFGGKELSLSMIENICNKVINKTF